MAKDPPERDPESTDVKRRQFLRDASVGSAVVAMSGAGTSVLTGVASADDPDPDFVLEAEMGGWEFEKPDIDGVNPPLELPGAGAEVTLRWENDDGFRHNFVIIDENGQELVRTPVITEGTQTVTFEVREDMFEYFCEIHPGSMRGDVLVDGEQPEGNTGSPIEAGEPIAIETIATEFTSPLGFEVAPGDDRQFVVDQIGVVFALGPDGREEFLDIEGQIVDLGVEELHGYDERGLLGLAFHPDFQKNRRLYVRYSAPRREGTPEDWDHTEVLSEFRADEDFGETDDDTERVLLELPSPQMNHNGGSVAFGPEGYLYTSIGDGGAANDVGLGHVEDWYDANEGGNGQDVTENLMGSILRIDVDDRDVGKPYAVPTDNPLVGREGLDEHFAWGFRNPWRMSFNDVPGDGSAEEKLFVGDAGQNLFEEVSIVEKGGNYGWNVKEGTHCFSTEAPDTHVDPDEPSWNNPPEECPDAVAGTDTARDGEPLLDPIIEYPHRRQTTAFIDGSVVIGGFVYENETVDPLAGRYVFANWSGDGVIRPDGEIFSAAPSEDGDGLWTIREHPIANAANGRLNSYVLSLGRDREGELYVLTNDNFTPTGETGTVYRIASA